MDAGAGALSTSSGYGGSRGYAGMVLAEGLWTQWAIESTAAYQGLAASGLGAPRAFRNPAAGFLNDHPRLPGKNDGHVLRRVARTSTEVHLLALNIL